MGIHFHTFASRRKWKSRSFFVDSHRLPKSILSSGSWPRGASCWPMWILSCYRQQDCRHSLLLTETRLSANHNFHVPGSQSYRTQHLLTTTVANPTGVAIHDGDVELITCSVYMAGTTRVLPTGWTRQPGAHEWCHYYEWRLQLQSMILGLQTRQRQREHPAWIIEQCGRRACSDTCWTTAHPVVWEIDPNPAQTLNNPPPDRSSLCSGVATRRRISCWSRKWAILSIKLTLILLLLQCSWT